MVYCLHAMFSLSVNINTVILFRMNSSLSLSTAALLSKLVLKVTYNWPLWSYPKYCPIFKLKMIPIGHLPPWVFSNVCVMPEYQGEMWGKIGNCLVSVSWWPWYIWKARKELLDLLAFHPDVWFTVDIHRLRILAGISSKGFSSSTTNPPF